MSFPGNEPSDIILCVNHELLFQTATQKYSLIQEVSWLRLPYVSLIFVCIATHSISSVFEAFITGVLPIGSYL